MEKKSEKRKPPQKKPNTKPIISWMGGKSRLVKKILPYFPEHTCYVEPFAGSAALLFAKPRAKSEVINDCNGELMNLYRVVQNHLEAFTDHLTWMLSSREHFERFKEADVSQLTDIQRAVRFFYLQKHAFGGRSDKQHFGTSAVSPSPFNEHHMINRLQEGCSRLKKVYIENLPWRKIIERYDRPGTLFYCDPPYFETAGYGVPFPLDEYKQLAKYMASIDGMMIISINDHKTIRKIFAQFEIYELSTKYTVGLKSIKAKELLIRNKIP